MRQRKCSAYLHRQHLRQCGHQRQHLHPCLRRDDTSPPLNTSDTESVSYLHTTRRHKATDRHSITSGTCRDCKTKRMRRTITCSTLAMCRTATWCRHRRRISLLLCPFLLSLTSPLLQPHSLQIHEQSSNGCNEQVLRRFFPFLHSHLSHSCRPDYL